MANKKAPRRREGLPRRKGSPATIPRVPRSALLDQIAEGGFHSAFHAHIQELSYELMKDPDYQEWMQQWAEGFLAALLEGLRRRKRNRKGNR
ncbi:MAG: hypothetical protein HY720_10830 [Planctomycetes bacterium]|nr:hypothetical protein [Planctomycetota bacterium]